MIVEPRFKNVDLALLSALDWLVRERSVSRAASAMCISQSAMTHALGRLRALIDDPILVRTKDGMVPTARALAIVEPLRSALSSIFDTLEPNRRFDPLAASPTYKLACDTYAGHTLLLPLLTRLRHLSPKVQLRSQALNPTEIAQLLELGTIDLAFGAIDSVSAPIASAFQTLFADPVVCIARTAQPYQDQHLSLERYLTLDHIAVIPFASAKDPLDTWLNAGGFHRCIRHGVNDYWSACALVTESELFLTAPSRIAESLAKRFSLSVIPLAPEFPSHTVGMWWHPRHESSPTLSWLKHQVLLMIEEFDDQPVISAQPVRLDVIRNTRRAQPLQNDT